VLVGSKRKSPWTAWGGDNGISFHSALVGGGGGGSPRSVMEVDIAWDDVDELWGFWQVLGGVDGV
jgi:hypothetical protein